MTKCNCRIQMPRWLEELRNRRQKWFWLIWFLIQLQVQWNPDFKSPRYRVRLGVQPKLLHHYQHGKTSAFSTVISQKKLLLIHLYANLLSCFQNSFQLVFYTLLTLRHCNTLSYINNSPTTKVKLPINIPTFCVLILCLPR